MKRSILVFSTLGFLCLANGLYAQDVKNNNDESLKKIFARGQVVNQGQDNLRRLNFDVAASNFLAATDEKYFFEGSNLGYPRGMLIDIWVYCGEYEQALKGVEWFFSQRIIGDWAIDDRKKIRAIIEWKKSDSKQPIYQFIDEYKKKYKDRIPPKVKWIDINVFVTVVELYDLIGDYDLGIAWVQTFRKADKSEPLKRTRKEYAGLIQAFEESKRGMPKECSADGKYCVGRATAYIIRSKYF